MAISPKDAQKIHQLAQDAGIPDSTLKQWTEEAGAYFLAIAGHTGAITTTQADAVRTRIKKHAAAQSAPAPAPAPSVPMATLPQIDYITSLLEQRKRSGVGGGFMTGPTSRDGIARMTRQDASTYIMSLREDY